MKVKRFIQLLEFDNGLWGLITRLSLVIIMKPYGQLHETLFKIKIWFQTRLLVPSNPTLPIQSSHKYIKRQLKTKPASKETNTAPFRILQM